MAHNERRKVWTRGGNASGPETDERIHRSLVRSIPPAFVPAGCGGGDIRTAVDGRQITERLLLSSVIPRRERAIVEYSRESLG
jgi:hypothetical protein